MPFSGTDPVPRAFFVSWYCCVCRTLISPNIDSPPQNYVVQQRHRGCRSTYFNHPRSLDKEILNASNSRVFVIVVGLQRHFHDHWEGRKSHLLGELLYSSADRQLNHHRFVQKLRRNFQTLRTTPVKGYGERGIFIFKDLASSKKVFL